MDIKQIGIISQCGQRKANLFKELIRTEFMQQQSEECKQIAKSYDDEVEEAWQKVQILMNECGIEAFSEYLEYLGKQIQDCNDNIKQKKVKSWKRTKFYE